MGTPFVYDALAPILDRDEAPDDPQGAIPGEIPAAANELLKPKSDFLEASSDIEEDELDFIPLCEDEQSSKPALVVDTTLHQEVPWLRSDSFKSPVLQLHQEILEFSRFISPTETERRMRSAAVERVTNCIKSLWPHSQVEVFGSFATGLYLPTSDVDMVVMNSGASTSYLRELAKVLRKHQLAKKLLIISKARVPLVKFVEAESGISFDISFDVANGPEAAKYIKRALASLPPLRPLCLVLKIFLQQRELNEVYTGGIGSYALLVMLLVHLQLHPSRQSHNSDLEQNLGILLMDFLELYGRSLNIREVGVSSSEGGRFFLKSSKGFYDKRRPYLLAVEDPQAPENDIGKNSFNIPKVRSALMMAHRLLSTSDGASEKVGLLGRVIHYDQRMMGRKDTQADAPLEGDKEERQKKRRRPAEKVSKEKGDSRSKKQHNNGKKWIQANEADEPSKKQKNKRGRYTDHYDNGEVTKKPSHKKIKRW